MKKEVFDALGQIGKIAINKDVVVGDTSAYAIIEKALITDKTLIVKKIEKVIEDIRSMEGYEKGRWKPFAIASDLEEIIAESEAQAEGEEK